MTDRKLWKRVVCTSGGGGNLPLKRQRKEKKRIFDPEIVFEFDPACYDKRWIII